MLYSPGSRPAVRPPLNNSPMARSDEHGRRLIVRPALATNKRADAETSAKQRKLVVPNSITLRPQFEGPNQYLQHVLDCLATGHEPFAPVTLEELRIVFDERPEFARRWLPPADECERLGIDPKIGQPVEPLTEREQERFLVTLANDDDFRVALRTLLLGGAI